MVLNYFRGASSSGGASWQAQQHRDRLAVRRFRLQLGTLRLHTPITFASRRQ